MDRRKKALEVDKRLNIAFGEELKSGDRDLIHELIHAVLSQNTSRKNYELAYSRLVSEFPSIEEIAEAPVPAIEATIRPGGLSKQKAVAISGILASLEEKRGDYSLEFLRDFTTEEVRKFLTSLNGVGPKTASVVLMFGDGRQVLPVDTHVLRISRRLGLINPSTTAGKAEIELERIVPPSSRARMHLNMVRLGREICGARAPKHGVCPLNMLCEYLETW
ncbi:MAG: endonuclease III [Actinobacteria bacterium]|nr:endonuclease III [Actinomycetota bacterium]